MRAGRAAVLGSPIEHSLSPVLHRAAYAELGLAWRYDAFECNEAGLAGFLDKADQLDKSDDEFAGFSLTMPLKRAVLPLLDDISPLAVAVGAVNTVTFGVSVDGVSVDRVSMDGVSVDGVQGRERRRRRGDNTDVAGIVDAIRACAEPASMSRAVILGAGGTAAAAVAACRDLGLGTIGVVVRDRLRASELVAAASRLNIEIELLDWPARDRIADASLVISTVPAGAADELVVSSGGPFSGVLFSDGQLVFDVLYHPWPTAFAAAAYRAGASVIGGLELLVRQAGVQVELMTGCVAPIDAMRAAGVAALAARGSSI